jgi:hypothetical protein
MIIPDNSKLLNCIGDYKFHNVDEIIKNIVCDMKN